MSGSPGPIVRWWLLKSPPGFAAENMAADEALLEHANRLQHPLLRFYSWKEAAASFGYFQHYARVAQSTPARPLVRRPTGGGMVPHEADWTYSLVFPVDSEWYQLKASESYQRVHSWIQEAFAQLQLPTELAPARLREIHPGNNPAGGAIAAHSKACFLEAERFDLLWNSRKIAGGAQRRNRFGLLIQGSIQPPPGADRQKWEAAFCQIATRNWGVEWRACQMDEVIGHRIHELVQQKYGRDEYNRRR